MSSVPRLFVAGKSREVRRFRRAGPGAAPRWLRWGAAGGVASAVLGLAPTARAEWVLGLEPTASMMVDGSPRFGPSLAASLGYSADLYPLLLAPELAVAGSVYPGSSVYGLGRAQLGVRVGVTASVEPAAYFRVGYGFASEAGELGHGLALDAGAALEGRLSRELTIGGTLGYQGLVAGAASHHGITAGLRLGIWF